MSIYIGVAELCRDPWTTADLGPMPPEADCILVNCDSAADEKLRAAAEVSATRRRHLLYALYIILAVGAMWVGSHGQSSMQLEMEDQ